MQSISCISRDYSFLPVTPDGYHVIYHALKDFKASAYHFENAVRTHFMLIGKNFKFSCTIYFNFLVLLQTLV